MLYGKIFDGLQEAINGVQDFKNTYGNGVSTQIIVGNLLSENLKYPNHKNYWGRWQNRYLVEVMNCLFLGCILVHVLILLGQAIIQNVCTFFSLKLFGVL
jgi:hypothetical protein